MNFLFNCWTSEWIPKISHNADDLLFTRQLQAGAKAQGLDFHVSLSPIRVSPTRDRVSPPSNVEGDSFGDESIRTAFKAKVMELAALEIDELGIGSEVNYLAKENPEEFEFYRTLAKETYDEVKAAYPDQEISISFAYDVEKLRKEQY